MTTLLWLQASGCGGCTMSLLCAESPGLPDLLADAGIVLLRHPALSLQTGAEARALLEDVAEGRVPVDILCVEGAIARGPAGTGRFQMLSGTGRPLMHWVTRIAARARHVVAVGTCAAYGGVTAAGGNPTDAVGLQHDGARSGGLLSAAWRSLSGQPVINVAGCPTHPGWVTETLMMLALGDPVALDSLNRPRFYADHLVHHGCPKNEFYEYKASARVLADAMGLTPTPQGACAAALIHAAENAADHLTHFHLFFMPDFTRPAYAGRPWHTRAVDRFTALEGSAQKAAIAARAELLHVMGLLAGKWPHTLAIQPGGVTRAPGPSEKSRLTATLRAFRRYLETTLYGGRLEDFTALTTPAALARWQGGDVAVFLEIAADLDLAEMGKGAGRYLSFGACPGPEGFAFAPGVWTGQTRPFDPAGIVEDLSHAWMTGPDAHPYAGQTLPDEAMSDLAYTWCKAPRLGGLPMEAGALARQIVDGHLLALALAAKGGVHARVVGRLLELARTQRVMEEIVASLTPGAAFMAQGKLPRDGLGVGLVEAARGALGHWLRIEGGRIASYQIVAPTTWNFSPRDAAGTPGPLELALEGAVVGDGETEPLAVQHIVRSFDPCMVCTVH